MKKKSWFQPNLSAILLISLLAPTTWSHEEKSHKKAETKEACVDKDKVYKTCHSQTEIYNKNFAEAKKANKLLLVKFGYENCPWCQNLHQVFKKSNFKDTVGKNFVISEIDITTETGKEVFNKVKGKYKNTPKTTGYPFLVFVNPKNNKTHPQETGDLEDNTKGKGHDLKKLKAALEKAKKTLIK